jgi:hypothetical protein
LNTLISAKAYGEQPHTVVTLDGKSLASDYAWSITLSRIDSGDILPTAPPLATAIAAVQRACLPPCDVPV